MDYNSPTSSHVAGITEVNHFAWLLYGSWTKDAALLSKVEGVGMRDFWFGGNEEVSKKKDKYKTGQMC
jgi:hypothetical protein